MLSTFIAALFIDLTYSFFNSPLTLVLSAYVIDAGIDLVIFSILHAIVNYHRGFKPFFFDLSVIQTHRVILALLFFIIAVPLDFTLMEFFSFSRTPSFIISYLGALIVTRVIHTIYGLKIGFFNRL